jgi:hypothetical protein
MDPLNLYLQVSLIGGAILASPFILYQVWLFIAPGSTRRSAVCGSLHGGHGGVVSDRRGLRLLLGAARRAQDPDRAVRQQLHPIVTIEEYTGFFLSIILGLGISFELPILIFFLACSASSARASCGRTSATRFWRSSWWRPIICPSPDPWTMCIYAVPMLALYLVGIGVAWWVHPRAARPRGSQRGCGILRKRFGLGASSHRPSSLGAILGRVAADRTSFRIGQGIWEIQGVRTEGLSFMEDHRAALILAVPLTAPAQQHFNGARALEYARQFVAIGPRWPTSQGHLKAEEFLRNHFWHDAARRRCLHRQHAHRPGPMRNFIVRFPGKKTRRHRAGHALRDQLLAQEHQLCGR